MARNTKHNSRSRVVKLFILKPGLIISDNFIRYTLFREIRDMLRFAHSDNLISEEECFLLHDLNKSSNLELPYWSYDQFDLDLLSDDDCKSEFRFYKRDVYLLAEMLQIPDQIQCYNRLVVDGIEALCIFLTRFAYSCRYSDMLPRFARPVPQLCMISSQVMI